MSINISCLGRLICEPNTFVGQHPTDSAAMVNFKGDALIRSGTIIYAGCEFGPDFVTGHNVLIRAGTITGGNVLLGSGTIVDGNVLFGDFIKVESHCYICPDTSIGNRCFLGPGVVLTNDRYPLKLRGTYHPEGPKIGDNVSIGGGAVICPGLTIGKGSFVGAGCIVTKDVPPNSFVMGNPGKIRPLPDKLRGKNHALSWGSHQPEDHHAG